jgi:hypothetical protein
MPSIKDIKQSGPSYSAAALLGQHEFAAKLLIMGEMSKCTRKWEEVVSDPLLKSYVDRNTVISR